MPTVTQSRPRRRSAAAAVLLLALAGALPGGAAGASPSPLPSPAAPAVREGTLPAEGGPVEPGTYQDWSLGQTLTFTLDDGWAATAADAGYGLALLRRDQAAPALVSIAPFTGLAHRDPCLATSEETIEIEPTAAGLAAELAANPSLIVGPPEEREVAGFPALHVEVGIQQPMACEPPVTSLWAIPPEGAFFLEDGEEAGFTIVETDAGVLVIAVEAYPGADYAALVAAAEPLIASLEIGPAPSPAPGG